MFRRAAPQLGELAPQHRLPLFSPYEEVGDAGALLSWTPDFIVWSERAAVYVDRILNGGDPAALPVEASIPMLYVVNLTSAHALGIHVPDAVLQSATRVIR